MPTRAIRVWNTSASAWESIGIEAPDSSIFLTQSTASATYLPISASANFAGIGGYARSFLLGGM